MSWWAAKTVDRACRTVGYQHTIVLEHDRELLGPQAVRPQLLPDVVLCTGVRTQAMLQRSHPASVVAILGTFRRASGERAVQRLRPRLRTVLVLPEGHLDESVLLFDTAIRAARRLPDHRFILRCHPVLPFERIRQHLAEDLNGQSNIEVSARPSIEEDFARSSALLYRGSSSVLYGVLQGLKPVYLKAAGHHDMDPLFELTAWREHAESPVHE
jgi:hypothetical protein